MEVARRFKNAEIIDLLEQALKAADRPA